MLKVVDIQELQPGMFVNQVLEQTGKLKIRTKGLVKTQKAITMLKQKGIKTLEVDLAKSLLPELQTEEFQQKPATTEGSSQPEEPAKPQLSDGQALAKADKLYQQAKVIQKRFFKRISIGDCGDLSSLQQLSSDIIDTVFETPFAISFLTQIKDKDSYFLEHSLNCAILMAIFGRHLGFDRETIEEISLGGLLMDTGMVTIPDDILQYPGPLKANEFSVVKAHVDLGIEMVEQSGDVSDVCLGVMTNHHERLDGSGYPEGRTEQQISVYGRMAAIVDTYDALISERPYRKAMTPTNALKLLLSDSSSKLDQSLLQQFIKCVGVHPVGSLVKLKSGKLAIIARSNCDDPLKPVVYSFYSVRSGNYSEIKRLDLRRTDDSIETTVRPEEFSINLTKFFREVFLGAVE